MKRAAELRLLVAAALLIALIAAFPPAAAPTSDAWWNDSWRYRVPLSVGTNGFDRQHWPVELEQNFTDLLRTLGSTGTLDPNSIRILEYSGGQPRLELPSQFDPAPSYQAATNAIGTVAFSLNGTTTTTRSFYLYFDVTERSNKTAPSYGSDINWTWDGANFSFRSTNWTWNISTNHSQNTSGLFRASGPSNQLFDIPPSDRSAEYMEYQNASNASQNLSFRPANATITAGPVRVTLELSGPEIHWGGANTTAASFRKTYTFYRNTSWFRVSQNLTANASISRNSTLAGALAVDSERVFGAGYLQKLNLTTPGSWVSASPSWVATFSVIHYNQSGTANFGAANTSNRVGLQLNTTNLTQNQSIRADTVLLFDDVIFDDLGTEALKQRLVNPASLSLSPAEQWEAAIAPAANGTVFNRMELILLTTNTTSDPYNLTASMNATLNRSGSATSFSLADNASFGDATAGDKLFTNNYTAAAADVPGTWNLTTTARSAAGTHLNTTSASFTVSSAYFPALLAPNSTVTNRLLNATLTLRGVRNDTLIPGASLSCEQAGIPLPGGNITDLSNGTYVLTFGTPDIPGTYAILCNATRFNNTGSGSVGYTAEVQNTTVASIPTPANFTVTDIGLHASSLVNLTVLANHTANATAGAVNISLGLPTNWTANESAASCGSLGAFANCTRHFQVTVANRTSPGLYAINATTSWQNPNGSIQTNLSQVSVNVTENPLISILQPSITAAGGDGQNLSVDAFVLESAGNANLSSISYSAQGLPAFTFYFSPTSIQALPLNSSQGVTGTVFVPLGTAAGVHAGQLHVNATNNGTNRSASIPITITVSNLTSVNATAIPANLTAAAVTYASSEALSFTVLARNIGVATATAANVSLALPSGWTANATTESCGNVNATRNCSAHFQATVPAQTPPGTYLVNATVSWQNPNTTILTNTTQLPVNVTNNPILNASVSSLATTAPDGQNTSLGSFTIRSEGNANLTNISFSAANLTNLTVYLSPANITQLNANASQDVNVTVFVPQGQPPGTFLGTLSANATAGSDAISLNITVPENRTWTALPATCERAESPANGSVCDVNVTNRGNTQLRINITPFANATVLSNYTYPNTTAFNLSAGESRALTFHYNVSGITPDFFNATYALSSLDNATPLNSSFTAILTPFAAPLVSVNITPNQTGQAGNLTILVNVTDRSTTGINFTRLNITQPNGTVDHFNLTPFSVSGNLTQYAFSYPNGTNGSNVTGNTTHRGIYRIGVLTQDNTSANTTASDSFAVHALLRATVATLKSSYAQGNTGTLFFRLTDHNGTGLSSATANLTVRDSGGNLTANRSFITDTDGSSSPLPTFALASDAPTGTYTASLSVNYTDALADRNLTNASNTTFTVTTVSAAGLEAQVETAVVWYPQNIMKFTILVLDKSSGSPTDAATLNLTVLDPANNLYFATTLSNLTRASAGLYNFSYSMPVSTGTGMYLALVNASTASADTKAVKAFRVATGGPYDVRVQLLETDVPQSDYLDFDLTLINMGEVSQDVQLEYWVTDPLGTTWYYSSEAIFTPANQNTTISRNAFIFSNQPLGVSRINVKVTYDSVQAPILANTTFNVVSPTNIVAPPPPVINLPGPSGGGGTVTPLPEVIPPTASAKLIDVPGDLSAVRGLRVVRSITVQNTGTDDLKTLRLLLTGIPSPWYTITPATVSDLAAGNSSVFVLELSIPKTADPIAYPLTLTLLSDKATATASIQLRVFATLREQLEDEIARLRDLADSLTEAVTIAQLSNKDVTPLLSFLTEARLQLDSAAAALEEERYAAATDSVATARRLLDRVQEQLAAAPLKVEYQIEAVPLWLLAAIISLVITLNLGLFIWFRKGRRFPKLHLPERALRPAADPRELDRLRRMLQLLEQEVREGVISEKAYLELKKNTEAKLKALGRR